MIISFGDSFTWGYNFVQDLNRELYTYTNIISKKLNKDYINLSLPGSSNWRTARKIQSVNLNENDVVIILWSCPTRFEFGVSKKRNIIKPFNNLFSQAGDSIEIDNEIITKRFFSQLSNSTSDAEAKVMNDLAYSHFYNEFWYEEMFKIMYNSTLHILEKSKCKWMMFNGWQVQCKQSNVNFHENYIFPETTMSLELGRKKEDFSYWSKEEHEKVSEIILTNMKKIYE